MDLSTWLAEASAVDAKRSELKRALKALPSCRGRPTVSGAPSDTDRLRALRRDLLRKLESLPRQVLPPPPYDATERQLREALTYLRLSQSAAAKRCTLQYRKALALLELGLESPGDLPQVPADGDVAGWRQFRSAVKRLGRLWPDETVYTTVAARAREYCRWRGYPTAQAALDAGVEVRLSWTPESRKTALREKYRDLIEWSEQGEPLAPAAPEGDPTPDWLRWARDTLSCASSWPDYMERVIVETERLIAQFGPLVKQVEQPKPVETEACKAVGEPMPQLSRRQWAERERQARSEVTLRSEIRSMLDRPTIFGQVCYRDGDEVWVRSDMIRYEPRRRRILGGMGRKEGDWWVIRA